jgi:hypothetical protein
VRQQSQPELKLSADDVELSGDESAVEGALAISAAAAAGGQGSASPASSAVPAADPEAKYSADAAAITADVLRAVSSQLGDLVAKAVQAAIPQAAPGTPSQSPGAAPGAAASSPAVAVVAPKAAVGLPAADALLQLARAHREQKAPAPTQAAPRSHVAGPDGADLLDVDVPLRGVPLAPAVVSVPQQRGLDRAQIVRSAVAAVDRVHRGSFEEKLRVQPPGDNAAARHLLPVAVAIDQLRQGQTSAALSTLVLRFVGCYAGPRVGWLKADVLDGVVESALMMEADQLRILTQVADQVEKAQRAERGDRKTGGGAWRGRRGRGRAAGDNSNSGNSNNGRNNNNKSSSHGGAGPTAGAQAK